MVPRLARWMTPLALLLALSAAGCRWTKEGRRTRHLAQGEGYFADKKYKEAVIEYKNVLKVDGKNPRAIRQLGIALYEAGAPGEASGYLRRASEADPSDLEVRLRLANVFLMTRVPEKAREHASFILAKQPTNLPALTVLAQAAQTDEEVDDAIKRLEDGKAALGEPDTVNRLLGMLYVRKHDVASAEKSYASAVSSKPDSPDSHLALARLHLSENKVQQAEQELLTAARLSPTGSPAQLQLADFYVATRRPAEARHLLVEATQKAPKTAEAWLRLGELSFREGKLDEAARAADEVLKADPDNHLALLLRARVHLARGETSRAIEAASKVAKNHPGVAAAHYVLALAHVQSGNAALAISEAQEAVRIAPSYTEAVLLTAELQVQAGAAEQAIPLLKGFLDKNPKVLAGHELLGKAYLRAKDPVHATEAFRDLAALAPKDARAAYLVGTGLAAQGNKAEARRQFEQALVLDPAFADALAQLAALSFQENRSDAAIERIRRQSLAAPQSAQTQFLLGRAHRARQENTEAEAAYLKAIALDPNLLPAYVELGAIYRASGQFDRAIQTFEKAVALNPKLPGSQMLLAVTWQSKGDTAKAREAYEKILAANPKFAPAANNLAWLLAEEGDLQRAQNLAQTARDAAGADPNIADTLGWILYKQSAYPRALALFKESATKLGEDPQVMYHLGMASHKLGQTAEAKEALTKALALRADFPGAAEAKATLATLK